MVHLLEMGLKNLIFDSALKTNLWSIYSEHSKTHHPKFDPHYAGRQVSLLKAFGAHS